MKRLVGFVMFAFGCLEMGFVFLVAERVDRTVFLAWSGGWCAALMVAGAFYMQSQEKEGAEQ